MEDHEERAPLKEAWNDQALCWEEVETEHLVRDKWIDFRRVKYRLPDGSGFAPFYPKIRVMATQ